MSETAEKLKPLLANLPADERAELVEYLLELGDSDDEELTQEEWESAWADEINRRIADAKAGKTDSMPHEEFMRQMKEKYG
jgi:putative addiction module component (TIGR02574 family)